MSIDVGARLRSVRTTFGLSQRELARRAGVTNGLISLIEQNRVSPSVSSLKKVLDAAGAGFSDILKITVFLTDIGDRTKINPVRQRHFGQARPASTLIGVNELAVPGMKLEIEAVVGLPGAKNDGS